MALAIIISIIGGISTVVSRMINAKLTNKIGIVGSTFFNYMVGILFSILLLGVTSQFLNIKPSYSFAGIPVIAYMGGLIGIFVVGISSHISLKASAFYVSLFTFIGQLFTGILIDYITLGTFSVGTLVGGILIFLGLLVNLQIDKKAEVTS